MHYADYGGFDARYFEGEEVDDPHPAGYSFYDRDARSFAKQADAALAACHARGVNPAASGASMLVVGCAYGYTVESLLAMGVDAWGLDVSTHATTRGAARLGIADRVLQGDAADSADIARVRDAAGGAFDAVLTECVLSTCTDDEAAAIAARAREATTDAGGVIHRVWSADGDGAGIDPEWYNVQSLDAWASICDPAGDDGWLDNGWFDPAAVARGDR